LGLNETNTGDEDDEPDDFIYMPEETSFSPPSKTQQSPSFIPPQPTSHISTLVSLLIQFKVYLEDLRIILKKTK
jgi:hypothetical protein